MIGQTRAGFPPNTRGTKSPHFLRGIFIWLMVEITAPMKAKIIVMPKRTVLDPQGKTVKHALESMNFTGIGEVRIGKFMEIELNNDADPAILQQQIDDACHRLLSNPVIEEYSFEIVP